MSLTGGSGGPLTNRLNESFVDAGITSTYHCFASGLDWTKTVGLCVYMDGSGAWGLKNPNDPYLLDADGTQGIVQIAKNHNMLLITPIAPLPGDADGDNCWYNTTGTPDAAQKADWLRALIDLIYSQYNIEKTRFAIGGYSSGAQGTTRFFLPRHGAQVMEDGVFFPISFGGSPEPTAGTPNFPQSFKDVVHGYWNTGTADTTGAYSSQPYGAIGGYDWYTANGFSTSFDWPVGVPHDPRGGDFQDIMDAQITAHVAPTQTIGGQPSSTWGTPKLGAIVGTSSSATLAVPYPAGVAAGDLLIIAIGARAEPGTNHTAPGWTRLEAQGASFARAGFLYKIADGTETGSVTVTGPAVAKTHKMLAISGADQTTPIDQAPTVFQGTGTVADPAVVLPSQTPTVAGTKPLLVASGFHGAGVTWTGPSGWTEWLDTWQEAGGTGRAAGAWHGPYIPDTTPTGTVTATPSTAATSAAMMLLLRPAAQAVVTASLVVNHTQSAAITYELAEQVSAGVVVNHTQSVTLDFTKSTDSAYASEVLADAPAAFWQFKETSGSNLADSSGNGHDLTVFGTTLGQVGPGNLSAVSFDGVDDYLRATGWTSVDTSVAWTYEMWAMLDTDVSVDATMDLMGQYYAGSSNHPPQLRMYGGNWVSYRRGGDGTVIVDDFPRELGAWTHLVYTSDGTTDRLYVDGVERANTVYGSHYNDSSDPLQIGYVRNGYFDGLIAAVVVYPTALTPTRIQAHYAAVSVGGSPVIPVPTGMTVTVDGTSIISDNYEIN